MKRIVLGILAHVDAGKTTLAEALLYVGGAIKKQGRVDRRDSFLDTHELERERGITIFSQQARIELPDSAVTLLDTPGHSDFSSETERAVSAMDYAVLVVCEQVLNCGNGSHCAVDLHDFASVETGEYSQSFYV